MILNDFAVQTLHQAKCCFHSMKYGSTTTQLFDVIIITTNSGFKAETTWCHRNFPVWLLELDFHLSIWSLPDFCLSLSLNFFFFCIFFCLLWVSSYWGVFPGRRRALFPPETSIGFLLDCAKRFVAPWMWFSYLPLKVDWLIGPCPSGRGTDNLYLASPSLCTRSLCPQCFLSFLFAASMFFFLRQAQCSAELPRGAHRGWRDVKR